jgi:hypothetical protein
MSGFAAQSAQPDQAIQRLAPSICRLSLQFDVFPAVDRAPVVVGGVDAERQITGFVPVVDHTLGGGSITSSGKLLSGRSQRNQHSEYRNPTSMKRSSFWGCAGISCSRHLAALAAGIIVLHPASATAPMRAKL